MSSGKGKERRKQKRAKERKDKQRQQRAAAQGQPAPRPSSLGSRPAAYQPKLSVPSPERCLPPVRVDGGGNIVGDARSTLGLPAEGPLDEPTVRAAWREALIRHPPEQDPEGARLVREARDRLIEPSRWLERELGELHVPDVDAWGLTPLVVEERLDPQVRMLGQMVLYTLVEDELIKPKEA